MSKHHGDFYSLNCFHFFATENNRGSHINLYQKPDKAPFIIYIDL